VEGDTAHIEALQIAGDVSIRLFTKKVDICHPLERTHSRTEGIPDQDKAPFWVLTRCRGNESSIEPFRDRPIISHNRVSELSQDRRWLGCVKMGKIRSIPHQYNLFS
jgi:hypothetical protein